ncbi:hypothetical protein Tco_1035989 [Tanacetum coccineum]
MAAPVISISSDVSVESVGSSFPRVILIDSISVEESVAPEVGAAAVASPAAVLELDTHSSSDADPSESSPPPVSVAPMRSLMLPFYLTPSAIVAPSSKYPLAPVVAPPGIRRHHSSSWHSISGHSLSIHTPPDTTDADSSTPQSFVHPSLARTLRCSEAYLH